MRAEEPAPPFKPHTACIDFAGSPQHGPPYRPRGIPAGGEGRSGAGLGGHLRRRSRAWTSTPTARSNRIHAAGQQDVTRVLAERSSPNRFTFLEAIRLAGSVREEAAPGLSEETQRCSAHGAWTARRARQTRFDRTCGQSASRQRGQRGLNLPAPASAVASASPPIRR